MIRTLLVDDSRAYLTALRAALATDPEFEVVGEACDGGQALVLARALAPQLVLMDVQMPGQGGIAATAQLMQDAPCAVVVMSATVTPQSQQPAFEALRAGAVEVVAKPRDLASPAARDRLLAMLKAMAAVKVVRRRMVGHAALGLVALGSSTGGPPALCAVLGALPRDFAPSVLIAQHLAPGFAAGLRQWLASACALPVELVQGATPRRPGTVYLAADGCHLLADGDAIVTRPMASTDRAAPSVNQLFESLVPIARSVAAVLLTGMGTDGASGMLALRQAGGHTMAQDEGTALIDGMPRAARENGAALEVLALGEVGPRLVALTRPGREAALMPGMF